MKERPILFRGEMVRALLAGRKTQTRRVVALPRLRSSFVLVRDHEAHTWWPYQSDDGESHLCDDGCEHPYTSPYGLPGDRLWVRETHCDARAFAAGRVLFKANNDVACGWTSSIHMPRTLSRLQLEVTEVRVERLQDISVSDALAEGVTQTEDPAYFGVDNKHFGLDPRESYASLWDAITGAGAWASDPWVWAVSFRVITPTFNDQYSKPDRAPHEDGYRG